MDSKYHFSKNLEKDLRRIAGEVARIPDADPPDTLVDSIMARIQPKKVHWSRRLWRRMQVPISLTPLKTVPLAAVLVTTVLVLTVFLGRAPEKNDLALKLEGKKRSGITVVFTLDMADASNVGVIGSFNRWKPDDFKMHWDEGRRLWVLSLQLEVGRHEYAFIIDGKEVVPDPKALLQEDDGFGNRNSILIIERDNGNETVI